jgi:hypothetical protein
MGECKKDLWVAGKMFQDCLFSDGKLKQNGLFHSVDCHNMCRAWDGDDPATGGGQVELTIRAGSGQGLFRLLQVSMRRLHEQKQVCTIPCETDILFRLALQIVRK